MVANLSDRSKKLLILLFFVHARSWKTHHALHLPLFALFYLGEQYKFQFLNRNPVEGNYRIMITAFNRKNSATLNKWKVEMYDFRRSLWVRVGNLNGRELQHVHVGSICFQYQAHFGPSMSPQ